jgi:hypothetical protein
MKCSIFFAAAALTTFAGAANAWQVRSTCRTGTSHNLTLMCYVRVNDPRDFLSWWGVQAYCETTSPASVASRVATIRVANRTENLRIPVGCADGVYYWQPVTRILWNPDGAPDTWQHWSQDGDGDVFTCYY